MVLANGAIVLLVREEKNIFRLVFFNNSLKWLMMLERDNVKVKLLLHRACFSNGKKQKSHKLGKGHCRFTASLLF